MMHTPTAARSSPGPVALPAIGDLVDGKYRIEGKLGAGGMAVVLAARHLALDEPVALKLLLPEWADDPELVHRFVREGRAATKIRSEHVVRVHDVGQVGGLPYLVLERLDGEDLDAVLKRGTVPIPVAIDLLLQACEAIAEAHALGIVHRDLKPANLFLTHRVDGSPCMKVLDFGISKITEPFARPSHTTMPNAVMGSPHYMSPEQMQSVRDADARTDIWSLGVILYELLTGEKPWQAESLTALCATILSETPTPVSQLRADVPTALDAVVFRCLDKDPARRYPTIAELSRALATFGSDDARISAERITRVIEGSSSAPNAAWESAPPGAPRRFVRPMSAAARLGEDATLPDVRPPRRVSGYLVSLIVITVATGGGFVGLRRAGMLGEPVAPVSRDAPPPASTPVVPSSLTTVTSGPAAPASTTALAPTAAPTSATPPGPSAAPPTPIARHHRRPSPRAPAPLPDFPIPPADDAFEAPTTSPTTAAAPLVATPAATATPPADRTSLPTPNVASTASPPSTAFTLPAAAPAPTPNLVPTPPPVAAPPPP